MRNILTVLTFLACLALLPLGAAAQADTEESKRSLILEIIALTNEGVDVQQEFLKGFHEQWQASNQALESISGSQDDDEATKEMMADMERRYKRMQERIVQRVEAEVDFKTFSDKVMYEYYDKSFSENELRELLAFFRTPIGKKWMETGQSLHSEIMKASEAEILPQVLRIVKEITDEEFEDLNTDSETADGVSSTVQPDYRPPIIPSNLECRSHV